MVGDGRNFVIVSDCCDGVEFGDFVVLSRAGGRFILCCGSICLHSVGPCHPTLQRRQLVANAATVYRLAPLAGSCRYSSFKRTGATRDAAPTRHRIMKNFSLIVAVCTGSLLFVFAGALASEDHGNFVSCRVNGFSADACMLKISGR